MKKLTTIREQVYKILKDAICNGDYKPGEWLQENDLAEKLDVSRSPIREALRLLVADGLVMEIPNKGVFVKQFNAKDIEEIFDLRLMLESYSIRKSKHTMVSRQAEELLDTLDMLEKVFQEEDLSKYIALDSKLHTQIIDLSNNSLIQSTYRQVGSMSSQFRIYALTENKRFVDSFTEHRDIIQNLIKGNVEQAELINETHLKLARERILKNLRDAVPTK